MWNWWAYLDIPSNSSRAVVRQGSQVMNDHKHPKKIPGQPALVIQVTLSISEKMFKDLLRRYFCHEQDTLFNIVFLWNGCYIQKGHLRTSKFKRPLVILSFPVLQKGMECTHLYKEARRWRLCANRNQPHLHHNSSSQPIPIGVRGFGHKGNHMSRPGQLW